MVMIVKRDSTSVEAEGGAMVVGYENVD